MFDVLAADGEEIHVLADGAEAHEAFCEQFACPEFQGLRVERRHDFEDTLPLANMRAFIGTNEIRNMTK
jgi:hypothetical protein